VPYLARRSNRELSGARLCRVKTVMLCSGCEHFYTDFHRQIGAGSRAKGGVVTEVAMSESDQFRRYAEEAILWVVQSKTEEEKQILVELLCTWTAAVASERIVAHPTMMPTTGSSNGMR
jgi:hypothetical protein